MSFFAAREAQTTLACPVCRAPLRIVRSCHEVQMLCKACGGHFPLRPFINQADAAMEQFLDNVHCDRM